MISTALYITIYAILFSLLEIEAEGKHGWAKKLPTPPALFTLTTYHVIMNIMVIFTLVYSLYPNNIYTMIFYIVAWFLIEDTMWFMLNPHYTIHEYKRENIWWLNSQNWYMGMPLQNYIGLGIMMIAAFLNKSKDLFYGGLTMAIAIGIILYLAPYYHQYYINTHGDFFEGRVKSS